MRKFCYAGNVCRFPVTVKLSKNAKKRRRENNEKEKVCDCKIYINRIVNSYSNHRNFGGNASAGTELGKGKG